MTQLTVKILITEKKTIYLKVLLSVLLHVVVVLDFQSKHYANIEKENIESQKYEKFTTRIAGSDPMTFGDSKLSY